MVVLVNLSDEDPPSADWWPALSSAARVHDHDRRRGRRLAPAPESGLSITHRAAPAGERRQRLLADACRLRRRQENVEHRRRCAAARPLAHVRGRRQRHAAGSGYRVVHGEGGRRRSDGAKGVHATLDVGSALQIDARRARWPRSRCRSPSNCTPGAATGLTGGRSRRGPSPRTWASSATRVTAPPRSSEASRPIRQVPADVRRDRRPRPDSRARDRPRCLREAAPDHGEDAGRRSRRQAVQASAFAQGGVGSLRWSVVRGALPAGLRLDSGTGVITGRPARRGRSVLYLAVEDELGAARSMQISIVIQAS